MSYCDSYWGIQFQAGQGILNPRGCSSCEKGRNRATWLTLGYCVSKTWEAVSSLGGELEARGTAEARYVEDLQSMTRQTCLLRSLNDHHIGFVRRLHFESGTQIINKLTGVLYNPTM